MLPDRVSNQGPLTYESGALPIALRGPAPKNSKGIILGKERVMNSYEVCRFEEFCVPRATREASLPF